MAWPPPVLSTNKSNDFDQENDHPLVHNALAAAMNDTTAKIQGIDAIDAAQDARIGAVEAANAAQQGQIDAIGSATTNAPLVIRPWTGDGSWGSLAHKSMAGGDFNIISQPGQPTYFGGFANQATVIRRGGNDAGCQFEVGALTGGGRVAFFLTGGGVYHRTPGSPFVVQGRSDACFCDSLDIAGYYPARADDSSELVNDNAPIRYLAPTHVFGGPGAPSTVTVTPASGQIVVARPGIEGGPWWARTLRLDANAGGSVGISFGVHAASWAVVLQANPGSVLAPCVDSVLADNSDLANLNAAAYYTISTAAAKTNILAVDDPDLLTRLATVQGQRWTSRSGPLFIDPATNTAAPHVCDPAKCGGTPAAPCGTFTNATKRRIGIIAEDVITPFPELVAVGNAGEAQAVDIVQVSALALAGAAALAREVETLKTQVAALDARLDATPGAPAG